MCEKEILEKWPNKREKIRECLTAKWKRNCYVEINREADNSGGARGKKKGFENL